MTYEIYREIAEEEYFRTEAIAAWEEEVERATMLHGMGESDGRRLKAPRHLEQISYWDGYREGIRQYWLKKLNLSATEEI